jgi:hypothetical protein
MEVLDLRTEAHLEPISSSNRLSSQALSTVTVLEAHDCLKTSVQKISSRVNVDTAGV